MTLSSRLTAFITLLALALAPLAVVAQDDESADESAEEAPQYSPELIEEVNTHFKTGAQHYYDGEYDQAISEFEAAHSKIPNAIFLYNISLAHNRKGDQEQALQKAEEAEAMGGLSETDQAQNRARIASLYRAKTAERTAVDVSQREPVEPPAEPLLDFSLVGWIGTGLVVGGVLAYGGVLGIDRALNDDVEAYKAAAERQDVVEYNRLRDEIRPRQSTGRALFVLGTLAVLGGAALVVYDLKFDDEANSATVTVAPTRDGASLAISGRF